VNFRYSDPYETRPFNILDETTHATEINNRFKYFLEYFQFTLIGRLLRENYQWATFEVDEPGSLINEMTDRKMHFIGGFLAQWEPTGNFIAKAGVSYNDVRYQINDLQVEDAEFEKYRFDPVWSPSVGVNYEPIEKLNIFASVSHGFSPPSLEETLMPDGLVNTDLQPEKALMSEIGVRWSKSEWLQTSVAVYAMEMKDMLVTRRLAEDQFMGVNAGKVHYTGVEAEITIRPLKLLALQKVDAVIHSSIAHSVNRFVDFTDLEINYDGNHLPGIPEYHWHNALSLKYQEKYSLHLDHSITGRQYMTDDNALTYKGHQITNLSASARFGKLHKSHIVFSTGVRNLFDIHYASMILINASSFGGSSPRYYYPGAPRNFYVSIQINL
jgi:iron complex outermembrane receptor protein